MQRSALCRSRRELSKSYLVAKFGFDTAENEPWQVCSMISSVAICGRVPAAAATAADPGWHRQQPRLAQVYLRVASRSDRLRPRGGSQSNDISVYMPCQIPAVNPKFMNEQIFSEWNFASEIIVVQCFHVNFVKWWWTARSRTGLQAVARLSISNRTKFAWCFFNKSSIQRRKALMFF